MLNIVSSVVCVTPQTECRRETVWFWQKAKMVLVRAQDLHFFSQQYVFQVLKLCLQ